MPRRPARIQPPAAVAVTIAASDSSGGAGIQADLAVFAAHGVYGGSVVTAVTAQSTRGVVATEVLPAAFVARQLEAVLPDLAPRAVKVGALGNAAIVRAVARCLTRRRRFVGPGVLDPVLASKDGSPLLARSGIPALLRDLFPLCLLVTPNLPEAEALAGIAIRDEGDRRLAAGILADRGAAAVLVKGGHGRGPVVDDLLFDGRRFRGFRRARIPGRPLHGTGCALSAAIAANLALGGGLVDSVEEALHYLERAMANPLFPGRGRGVPAAIPRRGRGMPGVRRRRPKRR
jgi:hydroxymethylpyrimidine/phosphomethylpyrimidine kinase